jgi:hypothetical protein
MFDETCLRFELSLLQDTPKGHSRCIIGLPIFAVHNGQGFADAGAGYPWWPDKGHI